MSRIEDLAALGVDVWVRRCEPQFDAPTAAAVSAAKAPGSLDDLAADVARCTRCVLHETRTQTVFGVGDVNADLLVIGEAPGAEEDRTGEPFVGRAGQLLDSMLRAIGFSRQQVYIANILKCRPPGNRDPRAEEAAACAAYLNQQIATISPKAILAVGRTAAHCLLDESTPIGKMRGRQYNYGAAQTPVVVTYHPAYLLRSPREKAKSWLDLLGVKKLIEETES